MNQNKTYSFTSNDVSLELDPDLQNPCIEANYNNIEVNSSDSLVKQMGKLQTMD